MFVSPDVWEKTMRGVCQMVVRAGRLVRGPHQGRASGVPSLGTLISDYNGADACTTRNAECCKPATNEPETRRIASKVLGRAPRSGGLMFALGLGLVVTSNAVAQARATDPQASPPQLPAVLGEATKNLATIGVTGSPESDRRGGMPPSPEATMKVFKAVEAWVRAWGVPKAEQNEKQEGDRTSAALPDVAGACVTLRFGGVIVGRGEAFAGATDAPGWCIRAAAGAAMQAAEEKMPVERSEAIGPEGAVPKDGDPATIALKIRRLSSEMVISVELAGEPTPIEPATWDEAARSLSPGLDGVMAKPAGSNSAAVMFPAQMLNANVFAHRALASVIAKTIGEGGAAAAVEEPAKIRALHGVRMFRFRTTHLAQVRPGQSPIFLERGQRTVDWRRVMSRDEIEQFASRVEAHLTQRLAEPALQGELLCSRAIALYSIARSRVSRSGRADQSASLRPIVSALRKALADRQATGQASEDDVSASVLLGRLCAEMRGACEEAVWPLDESASRKLLEHPEPVVRTLRTFSLAGLSVGEAASPAARAGARLSCVNTLADVWQSQPVGAKVALLPWFGWAAVDPALAEVESGKPQYAAAFRELRERVWKHQISAGSAGRDEVDAIGGVRFSGVDGESPGVGVLPSWQTARPMAFLATMLRDPTLTETRERTGELVRLLSGVRFMRQLQVDEASSWMYADPARAMGGIRAGFGDSTLSLDASSMTLLFLTETLRSLDALATAGPPRPLPGAAVNQAESTRPTTDDASSENEAAAPKPAPKSADR